MQGGARTVLSGALACLLAAVMAAAQDLNGLSLDIGGSDDAFGGIMQRAEPLPVGPVAFGAKYMTGGAGEGDQALPAEDENKEEFKHRQEVKSDNVLPAYCEPPNPCPVGYGAEHGCLEEFENSAEFSRAYQAQQQCICDQEHMFNCAAKDATESADNLQDMINESEHQAMIAKKFHEKRARESFIPRRKRSIDPFHKQPNPYLQGAPLRSMSKKNGRKAW